MFIWYLIFIILSFLQPTVLPVDLLLLCVISLSALSISVKSLQLFFWIGLLSDLIYLRPLGQTAILYLIIGFIIMLYGQKYQPKNPLFILIFTFLATIVENKLFFGVVLKEEIVWHLVLIVPVSYLFKYLYGLISRNNHQQLKLKI